MNAKNSGTGHSKTGMKQRWPAPREAGQTAWGAMSRAEEALFQYFAAVVTFHRAAQEADPFLADVMLSPANALQSVLKVQNNWLRIHKLYLEAWDHPDLRDEYVRYCRSFIRLNAQLDELSESLAQNRTLTKEMAPYFQQFRRYLDRKRQLLRACGDWS